MSFAVKTDWVEGPGPTTEVGAEPAEDEATLSKLAVTLNGAFLTRAEDHETGYIRNHAVLPAYRVAEWLTWNWWRLRWEPRPGNKALGWAAAHNMAHIGRGWLWPNITFIPDGLRVTIAARPSPQTPAEPLRYLADVDGSI